MVAVVAGESRPAVALVRPGGVPADAVVAKVLGDGALVDVVGAGGPGPAGGAGAVEPVDHVSTGGAIQTGAGKKRSTFVRGAEADFIGPTWAKWHYSAILP